MVCLLHALLLLEDSVKVIRELFCISELHYCSIQQKVQQCFNSLRHRSYCSLLKAHTHTPTQVVLELHCINVMLVHLIKQINYD